MKIGQNLCDLNTVIIFNFKPFPEDFQLDYVFVNVYTTTMAGSIASFYSGAKVCYT
mgnify:CR=1 FL=1